MKWSYQNSMGHSWFPVLVTFGIVDTDKTRTGSEVLIQGVNKVYMLFNWGQNKSLALWW